MLVLSELDLASNNISYVGNSLQCLPKLRCLNLAGNNIYSFYEILPLKGLKNLQDLFFCVRA